MKIDVNLNLNEKLKELDVEKVDNPLARGWVEIDGAIKFPVRVMKYIDKEDNVSKMFVSLPQKKNGDKYDEIVKPINEEIRDEVQNAVLEKLTELLSKNVILSSNVTDVKVNLLKEPITTGNIRLMAMASITLCGFRINGIQVKDGNKGLFIQMPQHKSGSEYQDTVYGTTTLVQQEISNKVIEIYESIIAEKDKQQKEEEKQNEKEDFVSGINKEEKNLSNTPSIPKRHRLK